MDFLKLDVKIKSANKKVRALVRVLAKIMLEINYLFNVQPSQFPLHFL